MGGEELFLDTNDRYRGIFCLYEFNTTEPIKIRERRIARAKFKKIVRESSTGQPCGDIVRSSKELVMEDNRDLLVEVLAFCFMPNHIHIMLRQLKNGGISKFMLKIESGYATYFKNKYGTKFKGHFFQDRFNCVHIETEEQLRILFIYIHTNAIALLEPHWKEKGIKDPGKIIKFLEKEYRWSSFFDYIGRKNFPSVTQRDFLLKVMGGQENCKKAVEDWVKHKGEIKKFVNLSLE